jgi:hypothetical protein
MPALGAFVPAIVIYNPSKIANNSGNMQKQMATVIYNIGEYYTRYFKKTDGAL